MVTERSEAVSESRDQDRSAEDMKQETKHKTDTKHILLAFYIQFSGSWCRCKSVAHMWKAQLPKFKLIPNTGQRIARDG